MSDSVTKCIEIAAPLSEVWDALTDHQKFASWFCVALDQPFALGQSEVVPEIWTGC